MSRFKDFIELYSDFPWVATDEERLKYGLISKVSEWYGEDGEKRGRIGMYGMSYIEPNAIIAVNEHEYDEDIWYCEIELLNGERYYYAGSWKQFVKEHEK